MIRTENTELKNLAVQWLSDLYGIKTVRSPDHLSTFVYCLTKAWYSQQESRIEPTENEVLLFALGYGLQDVLTPKDATGMIFEQEGITYSPDMHFVLPNEKAELLMELKTTRRSARKHWEAIPETWMTYMLGGCKMRGTNRYDLIVLYMMGGYRPPFPEILCDTFIFSDEEIEANWQRIQQRKKVLDASLQTSKPPTPFAWNYDWECKYCSYKMVCESVSSVRREEEE